MLKIKNLLLSTWFVCANEILVIVDHHNLLLVLDLWATMSHIFSLNGPWNLNKFLIIPLKLKSFSVEICISHPQDFLIMYPLFQLLFYFQLHPNCFSYPYPHCLKSWIQLKKNFFWFPACGQNKLIPHKGFSKSGNWTFVHSSQLQISTR
jgi:hypothetical protein